MQLDDETRKRLAEIRRRQILGGSGYKTHVHAKPAYNPGKKIIIVRRKEPGRDVPQEQLRRTQEVVEALYQTPAPEVEEALGRTQNLEFQNEVLDYVKNLKNRGVYLFNFSLKIPAFKDQTFVYWANSLIYNAENTDFFNKRLGAFLINSYNPFVTPPETEGILPSYANIDSSQLHKILGFFEQGDWDKLRTARGTIDQLVGAGNEVTGIYEIGKDRRR